MSRKKLSAAEVAELMTVLKERFEKNMSRHNGVKWADVASRLELNPEKLWSVSEMERTGGEPDVVMLDKKIIFVDCAPESPKGRRSTSYDPAAIESRKEHKPEQSAVGIAHDMGVELLSEDQYRRLQEFGEFDLKTSSWVATPAEIRNLGGAVFCDRRYDNVWTYHNGAESYYASRGFRGFIKL